MNLIILKKRSQWETYMLTLEINLFFNDFGLDTDASINWMNSDSLIQLSSLAIILSRKVFNIWSTDACPSDDFHVITSGGLKPGNKLSIKLLRVPLLLLINFWKTLYFSPKYFFKLVMAKILSLSSRSTTSEKISIFSLSSEINFLNWLSPSAMPSNLSKFLSMIMSSFSMWSSYHYEYFRNPVGSTMFSASRIQ